MIPLNGRPKTDLEELKRTPTSDGWKIIFYTSADVLKPANDGHFKTGQQGGTRQEYLYTVRGGMSKYFLGKRSGAVYTERTWAEDTATQGCDRSADSAAGMARSGASRSASHAAILAQQR